MGDFPAGYVSLPWLWICPIDSFLFPSQLVAKAIRLGSCPGLEAWGVERIRQPDVPPQEIRV